MAGVYGVFVGVLVYKEIKWSDLFHIMYRSVLLCAPVLIIIGLSTGFGRILTIAQIPSQIAEAILSLTSSKYLVLLPIVTAMGVNPIHFGVIVVMNLSIGFITPPLGANLFMACQVGSISFDNLVKKIWPWIVVMIVLLLLVTYVEGISMALPRALGLVS